MKTPLCIIYKEFNIETLISLCLYRCKGKYNISSFANKEASCGCEEVGRYKRAAAAVGDVGGRLMEAARCRQVSARWRMTDRC